MSKKILIVEDDEAFYNICATELKLKGYDVVHVSDGNLAVTRVKEEKPNLVLLDIILPGVNGLDILRELKEQDETKEVKVIMLTNFGTDDNISKAVELGADDYLMKYNIVSSELAGKLAQYLGEATADAGLSLTN
ncbi:response regulator [Patescibacteria group bacterium]|nr:response regulator [Patescibacteria group bacterium]